MKYAKIKVSVLLIVIACAGFFCLYRRPAMPDIFFITFDALRADHLGCYGYGRDVSPNIDKLAARGTLFSRAFSVSSGTEYSFPCIFTGRYLAVGQDYILKDNILDQSFTTMAEYLAAAGYSTAAFIDNWNLRRGKGFEQGFEHYSEITGAENINSRVLRSLRERPGRKPLFMWLHYLEPHFPYRLSSSECMEIFLSDELYARGDAILQRAPEHVANPFSSTTMGYIPRVVFEQGHYNLNYYVARYDCAIRHADYYLGELLKQIKDDAIVIVSSDHGESLGEHGYYFVHEHNVDDKVLHVPLIIKDNRYFKRGGKVNAAVSSIDILPTIMRRIRPVWYFFNQHRFSGVALNNVLDGNEGGRRYLYSFLPWAWSIRDVKSNIKYIKEGVREALYFLPDEDTNYIDNKTPDSVRAKKELKAVLELWRKNNPVRADRNAVVTGLSRDDKEKLRSLGYMQ